MESVRSFKIDLCASSFCWFFCSFAVLGCGDDFAVIAGTEDSGSVADSGFTVEILNSSDGSSESTDAVSDLAEEISSSDAVISLGGPCAACQTTGDCNGPQFECVALLNGNFCASVCASTDDCSSGFTCDKISDGATTRNCIPAKFACDGCLVTGCPSGHKCDVNSGKCVSGKGSCQPCSKPADCGPGLKCAALASNDTKTQTLCMPECGNGSPCGSGGVCQKTGAGNVCGFTGLACCYGASCKVDSGCSKCPSKCVLGGCVDCLLDSDCPGGHCDITGHTCVTPGGCPKDKPFKTTDGTCVSCLVDADCSPGKSCSSESGKCVKTP